MIRSALAALLPGSFRATDLRLVLLSAVRELSILASHGLLLFLCPLPISQSRLGAAPYAQRNPEESMSNRDQADAVEEEIG